VGKRVHFATAAELREVIGIARDANFGNIGEQPQMVAYFPYEQMYQPFMVLHVRAAAAPAALIPTVQATVQSLSSDVALTNPGTMRQGIYQATWAPRMAAGLFGIFGVLGTVLAVIGVYGVITYMVLQRTSEIGIRMAIGASPFKVLNMVVGESAKLALIGIGIGLAAAFALTRFIQTLLFQVSANDPGAYATAVGLLALTALIAGAVPALRASRIDPVKALRE
jgi:ABC-type antimicrobial peptide transport system permease subunit